VTCRDVIEILDAYVAGELTPQRRIEVDRHLAECTDCTNYLAGYQRTQALAKDAFDSDEPPADMPDALAKSILAARRPD